jgi:hypothetical protein
MVEDALKIQVVKNLGSLEGTILLKYINLSEGNYYYTRIPLCENHFRIDVLCIENINIKFPISVLGDLDKLQKHLKSLRGYSGRIIEIKEKLNFEALGQIMTDIFYFPQEYPNIPIKQYSILCKYNDDCIERICTRHGISVITI